MNDDGAIDALGYLAATFRRRQQFAGCRWMFENQWRSMFTLSGQRDYCRQTRFHGVTVVRAECFLHRRVDDGLPCHAYATLILLGFGVSVSLFWTTKYEKVNL